jgi:ATP-grasp domain, R2K clade family 2
MSTRFGCTSVNLTDLVLAIPAKPDGERDAVGRAWQRAGGTVVRLDRFWEPPELPAARVRVYGPMTFALVVAEVLGLDLVGPPNELLTELPRWATQRDITVTTLGRVGPADLPAHVKPLVPKLFAAAIVRDIDQLRAITVGLDDQTAVLMSEVIRLRNEVRCFVCAGQVLADATYEGAAVPGAAAFVAAVLGETGLSCPAALDVGWTDGGWVVIEANDAWGAGLNGCDADAVLPALEAATRMRREEIPDPDVENVGPAPMSPPNRHHTR